MSRSDAAMAGGGGGGGGTAPGGGGGAGFHLFRCTFSLASETWSFCGDGEVSSGVGLVGVFFAPAPRRRVVT